MQEFLADLHIHSRFSRATSSKLNIHLLAAWAGLKGISVLGTGDFTHPKWREELARDLVFEEESGLYRLRAPGSVHAALPELPVAAVAASGTDGAVSGVRFMLQGEISSIYKRGGKVRKVHNLVYMPTLEAAERFSLRLEQVGNLHSDGRPILGLDSRDLLELVLETHPLAFLVPAHIWTPWFSLFGSKSGFDRMQDCFADLTSEIFALETGLSSDPAMNRLWSALDGCRLISNSDAHSGENLGREANVFSGAVSYEGMLEALKHPDKADGTRFRGTLEFFPEEGKYHMDGHRKCGVVLTPEKTREYGGICPVCGGPLTVGVLYRVMELADRDAPYYGNDGLERAESGAEGEPRDGFASLVPLPEVLGEILGVGPKSRKVGDMYARTLERFGPELTILRRTPESELARFFPPLAEAVARMRAGRVHLQGGFDGEYGVVRMFTDKERREIQRSAGVVPRKKAAGTVPVGLPLPATAAREDSGEDFIFSDLETGETPPEPAVAREDGPDERQVGTQVQESGPRAREDEPTARHDEPQLRDDRPETREDEPEPPLPQGLNPSQEHAVMAGPGPVLVLAGPGTGKTRTLIARILRLLEEGIGARRILAVTFTRRAASEMDERLNAALGSGVPLPRTDTLHALALEAWHKSNADVPVLLSEESARRVFFEANAEEAVPVAREAWQAINFARERLELPPPEYVEMAERYRTVKNGWNLADYTDLLEFWLERIDDRVYTCPWSHVLVDEVQDLSPLQLNLVRHLLTSSGEGFFGIGDPDQSIYSFRGAHGRCREFFSSIWPGLEVISLSHNYRSRSGILQVARAALGAQAAGPALIPARVRPASIQIFQAPGAEAEAAWVADRIAGLIGLGSHTLSDAAASRALPARQAPATPGAAPARQSLPASGAPPGFPPDPAATSPPPLCPDDDLYSPGDIAVLLRTHALAAPCRKALFRAGIPVSEPAADAFWADERVALILRAAGRILGIAGDEAEEKAPVCPDKVLTKGPLGVAAYLSSIPPFDHLFWQSSAFRALVKAYDANGGWAEMLTWINLQDELELVRGKGEKVQVISLHAAKGLEFRAVFLPCLEDGLLPFAGPDFLTGKLSEKKNFIIEEEQRLFYVGLTRAKDALYLSHAAKRMLYGRELRLKPSRFLEALPEDLLFRSTLVARTRRKEQHLKLF